jgi:hypothetical protein
MPSEAWGRWGPVDKNTCWRCEPLSFAYFSLRRQRKVGAAPHRGKASKPEAKRGCQRKHKQTTPASQTKPSPPKPKPQKARPAGPPIARFRHCRYSLWHGTFQVPLPVSSSRQATTLASSSAPAALIVFALRLPRSLLASSAVMARTLEFRFPIQIDRIPLETRDGRQAHHFRYDVA